MSAINKKNKKKNGANIINKKENNSNDNDKAANSNNDNVKDDNAIHNECEDHTKHNKSPIGGYIVGKLSEAPKYLHDNEFIEKGYRIGFNSWQKILKRYLINIIFFYAI